MKSCAGVWLSKRLPLIDTPRSENLESHDSIAMLRMWLQHEVCAFKRSVPKLDVTNVFDTAFTISYDTEGIAGQCGQARRKRLVEPGANDLSTASQRRAPASTSAIERVPSSAVNWFRV